MAALSAAPLLLGGKAPDFRDLLGVDGHRYSLSSFDGKSLLVFVFVGNGCPTVRAHDSVLKAIQRDYGENGLQLVAINANNPSLSPPDTYAEMVRRAMEVQYGFPYLKDEDRDLARKCGAVCTPHVFVFDGQRRLRYTGRIDDSREPSRATRHDLKDALDDLLAKRPVQVRETQPFGCSIVW